MSIQILNSGLQIEADAIATLALAALLLLLGAAVKNRVRILNHYCIPAPVVGGFLFMFLTFLGHVTGSFQVRFDTYFQSPFMLAFFTTVGLSASFSLLKRGGIMLVVYWLISGVISVIQNAIGIAVGTAIGLPAPYALLSSAISMIGGHGAAASYGAQFTEMGYDQAMLVGAAAATFGLITAVMIGGPLGSRLIERYKLTPDRDDSFAGSDVFEVNKSSGEARSAHIITENVTVLLVCMAVGAKVSALIGAAIGMSFPTYVGAMFVAVLVRNLNEKVRFFSFDYALVDGIGEVMAADIVNFFADPREQEIIDELLSEVRLEPEASAGAESELYAGKVFVITGSLTQFPNRTALKDYITARGGKVAGEVSAKTTALINNDITSGSSKNKKARELGIPIISEADFLANRS